ncbi:MAG: hypothetical protein QM811_16655 [Pirellulales bacterium]
MRRLLRRRRRRFRACACAVTWPSVDTETCCVFISNARIKAAMLRHLEQEEIRGMDALLKRAPRPSPALGSDDSAT